ncbi:MAG TPA: flavodoxin-dependent (E)-4-hydroxy-3-methylbut-2-enyl-diphosphate synthase [Candidatus Omnitrophota bacterium]|nr:flavodoxin-dependent (E)-4-hydroxy-3-methylbut-2-enyl-diphosphate synthase [Candidatus Omnitrophota bacterium]
MKRRKTRQISVGKVRVGGSAPVSIQSMTKVKTSDVKAVVAQIARLERCGCEIIRVAVKDAADAMAIRAIKKEISIPIVADIHFDYRLALESIKSGADKIRLNPGNIRRKEDVQSVIHAAKLSGIPIRIGVNSGSVSRSGKSSAADNLVKSAIGYIRVFEKLRFYDIILSLKASDVPATVEAYRRISKICDYPLHLGLTASGPYDEGIIKSAVGIGALLVDGIGDTVRVSLTAGPEEEVVAAKRILSAVGVRRFGPEIISCPTCGRCQVDLVGIVNALSRKLSTVGYPLNVRRPIRVAVMGCEVNGPGEAREADIGVAAGKGSGVLFVKGKVVRRVAEKDFIREILRTLNTKSYLGC